MFKIIFETKYNNLVSTNRIIFCLKNDSRTIEILEFPVVINGHFSSKTNQMLFCGIDFYWEHSENRYSGADPNVALYTPGAIRI